MSPPPLQDSFPGAGEARKFLLHFRRRHHSPPSRVTKNQTLHAERRIISNSSEIHWLYQGNTYDLGCIAGKPHRRLSESRWIKRFVWFLDRFHTNYYIEWKTSDGFLWSGERHRRQAKSRPDHLWPEIWKDMSKTAKQREKQKWAIERPKRDNARKLRGVFTWLIQRLESQNLHASWKPTNLQECVRKEHYAQIMKTTLQEKEVTRWIITILCNNLILCLKQWRYKQQVDKKWEKLEKIPAWQLTKVRNKNEAIEEARKGGKTVHFAS